MFANTTVSHNQNEIVNVYQPGSGTSISPWMPKILISQVSEVITAPTSTTNITGLRICTRGSSLITLSMSARLTMSRWKSETARRSEGVFPRAVSTDINVPFTTG